MKQHTIDQDTELPDQPDVNPDDQDYPPGQEASDAPPPSDQTPTKRGDKKSLWINISMIALLIGLVTLGIINRLDYRTELLCRGIDIVVQDSAKLGFINSEEVRKSLNQGGFNNLLGLRMDHVDISAIERFMSQNPWIEDCQVYGSVDGVIRLVIKQREPLMRIMTAQGENYYIDSLKKVMPSCSHFYAEVPIVSGTLAFGNVDIKESAWIEKKDPKCDDYMKKLINFAKNVSADEFLRNLIVQIHINDAGQIELIPRISSHVIIFGDLNSPPEARLAGLKYFYMNGASIDGFETFTTVDVRYRNQIITR